MQRLLLCLLATLLGVACQRPVTARQPSSLPSDSQRAQAAAERHARARPAHDGAQSPPVATDDDDNEALDEADDPVEPAEEGETPNEDELIVEDETTAVGEPEEDGLVDAGDDDDDDDDDVSVPEEPDWSLDPDDDLPPIGDEPVDMPSRLGPAPA